MAERKWIPGEVAMRSYLNETLRSLRVAQCHIDGHQYGAHWHHEDGGWDRRDGRSTYRPLVVIDPEDREQAIRLTELFYAAGVDGDAHHYGRMQAALREFASPTPPKPDEPKGLGAVVETDGEVRYVRRHDGTWESEDECQPWRYVNAVRVLSEGVTS